MERGFRVRTLNPVARTLYEIVGNLGLDDGLLPVDDHTLEYEVYE